MRGDLWSRQRKKGKYNLDFGKKVNRTGNGIVTATSAGVL